MMKSTARLRISRPFTAGLLRRHIRLRFPLTSKYCQDYNNAILPLRFGHGVLNISSISMRSDKKSLIRQSSSNYDNSSRPFSSSDWDGIFQDKTDAWDENLQKETDQLINQLEDAEEYTGIENNKTTTITMSSIADYDRVIEAWSKYAESFKNGIDAAEQAESLLDSLERNLQDRSGSESPLSSITPDAITYNKVIHAYAVSGGGREAAIRAQSILERMLKQCHAYSIAVNDSNSNTMIRPPEPTTQTFNIVVNAWAKSGIYESGKRAEEIFTLMEEWYYTCQEEKKEGRTSHFHGARPNVRTLCSVIDAWAQSNNNDASYRVVTVLEHMIEKCHRYIQQQHQHYDDEASYDEEDGVEKEQEYDQLDVPTENNCNNITEIEGTIVKPNIVMFNSVIHAIVNSGKRQDGANKAEEILDLLMDLNYSGTLEEVKDDEHFEDDVGLKPNTRTLTLVLDAWARCNDYSGVAAERADLILNRMVSLYNEGFDTKPNYISFTTVITAWSRSRNRKDAASRAEAILDQMIDLYRKTEDEDFKPTTTTFNAVITAWARAGGQDSARRAENVLNKLEEFNGLQPDSYSYTSIIDAYAKRGYAQLAQHLLGKMDDLYNKGIEEMKPNIVAYNSVLNAFSKSKQGLSAAHQAEALLEKMEGLSSNDRPDMDLDVRSYSSVIDCWAYSDDTLLATKADAVLRRMKRLYEDGKNNLQPDVFIYNRLIHACGKTNGTRAQKRQALEIALLSFEELKENQQYGKPNSRTYGNLITTCSKLASVEKECSRLVESIFKQCCNAGEVNDVVFRLFLRNVPADIRSKHIGLIPRWSRNVPSGHRPRQNI